MKQVGHDHVKLFAAAVQVVPTAVRHQFHTRIFVEVAVLLLKIGQGLDDFRRNLHR